jgi:outer membrane murein-binding lipoprotein Lpp
MNQLFPLTCHKFGIVALVVSVLSVAGCAPNPVTQQAVADYKSVASQISIGDAREHVLAILQTNQQAIPLHFKRRPERYLSYGEQVEIHFVRTGTGSGGSNNDDDFTPYVFKNDVLVSVGWTYVSKTDFLNKAREAISAGGVKQDQDVVGDRR